MSTVPIMTVTISSRFTSPSWVMVTVVVVMFVVVVPINSPKLIFDKNLKEKKSHLFICTNFPLNRFFFWGAVVSIVYRLVCRLDHLMPPSIPINSVTHRKFRNEKESGSFIFSHIRWVSFGCLPGYHYTALTAADEESLYH